MAVLKHIATSWTNMVMKSNVSSFWVWHLITCLCKAWCTHAHVCLHSLGSCLSSTNMHNHVLLLDC